jgi:L-alanine-DL-glutamate epimerase-like enolase superfamily enzyme
MKKATQIRSVETLACDAGWRNYHFVKIVTEDGIVGWSEYDEGFGAPGVTAAIDRLAARVVDASVMPAMPSPNIHPATIMVAEKGSDIIAQALRQ